MLFSEPKIPQCSYPTTPRASCQVFQCSSASRKFLNSVTTLYRNKREAFQCSSASRKFLNRSRLHLVRPDKPVSVLFSEPKIPQLHPSPHNTRVQFAFQCSSASRKFLNCRSSYNGSGDRRMFQCSSASRKFLNRKTTRLSIAGSPCFSALQRAENSSILRRRTN